MILERSIIHSFSAPYEIYFRMGVLITNPGPPSGSGACPGVWSQVLEAGTKIIMMNLYVDERG